MGSQSPTSFSICLHLPFPLENDAQKIKFGTLDAVRNQNISKSNFIKKFKIFIIRTLGKNVLQTANIGVIDFDECEMSKLK